MDEIASDLRSLSDELDHRHRQQRKVQFLLDIRGYLAMNRLVGDYIEFGLFRGEMMFSAHHILDRLGVITRYVGFESFAGEPEMTEQERSMLPFLKPGDYCADEQATREFLEKNIGPERLRIVKGDFRNESTRGEEPSQPVAVGVIDCNLPSSIEAACGALLPRIVPGGVLFLDDYFLNVGKRGFWHTQALTDVARRSDRRLVYFQTYPPCARAYIAFDAPERNRPC